MKKYHEKYGVIVTEDEGLSRGQLVSLLLVIIAIFLYAYIHITAMPDNIDALVVSPGAIAYLEANR